MTLDWVRIVAQLLNFVLLLWLLRKFLFAPLTNIMAAREERVRKGVEQAEQLQRHAEELQTKYESELAGLEAERQKILKEASDAAAQVRDDLIEDARKEARTAHTNFHAQLEREKHEIQDAISRQIIENACDLASLVVRQVMGVRLADLAATRLIERMADRADDQAKLKSSLVSERAPVVVISHAELSDEATRNLTEAVFELAGTRERKIEFRVDPDLLVGVSISTGGATLSWNAMDQIKQVREISLEKLALPGGNSE